MSETATGQSKLADWTLTPEDLGVPEDEKPPAELMAILEARRANLIGELCRWDGSHVTMPDGLIRMLGDEQSAITALREAHPELAGSRTALAHEIMRAVDRHADLSSDEYGDLVDAVAGILARRL